MPKDTYYFSHDYNARNDEKILELRADYGAEGYGLFWMIAETMAENDNGGVKATLIGGLSMAYGVTKEKLSDFIKYCISIDLFFQEEGFIFSKRMKKHKDFRKNLSIKGGIGAKKRWGGDSPPISIPNAKERKGKEIVLLEENKKTIPSDFVCYNAEEYILENQVLFEKICIATGKTADEVKKELHLYHLWMAKNEKYPLGKKAAAAGIESWLHNGKHYSKKYQSQKNGHDLGKVEKLPDANEVAKKYQK